MNNFLLGVMGAIPCNFINSGQVHRALLCSVEAINVLVICC